MINENRIKTIKNSTNNNGGYIIYLMSNSLREDYNYSLELAILKANQFNLPLLVCYRLPEIYYKNNRYKNFIDEGIGELIDSLNKRMINILIIKSNNLQKLIDLLMDSKLLIVDKEYLKDKINYQNYLFEFLDKTIYEVDNNLVVPVEISSNKEEYGAYTIRPKITKRKDEYIEKLDKSELINISIIEKYHHYINKMPIISDIQNEENIYKTKYYKGGEKQADKLLNRFIKYNLENYGEKRNELDDNVSSNLSPYLAFGMISPVKIALKILSKSNKINKKSIDDFLEQLIVRRELTFNFCYYNKNYDELYQLLPEWAVRTLKLHSLDDREYIYDYEQLLCSKTHDEAWNACQMHLLKTGKMPSYMRMYWGKKIIEWTNSPEKAFEYMIRINNSYAIDGNDPNSYAGISWCFGKHDRAWTERDVFGKLRYMNYNGLKRKYNIDNYIKTVQNLS